MADVLPGTVWRESEFQAGLTGACGPNALAMAESWASQHYHSTLSVYQRMLATGRCDPNGPSTIGGLFAQAQADGYVATLLPYAEPLSANVWRSFFQTHIAANAVVMETANGQALIDYLTGKGENARNLRYHFFLLVGWHPGGHSPVVNRVLPPGWFACDGDNYATPFGGPQINQFQFYTDSVLAAAQPCAALAIASQAQGVPMAWQQQSDGSGKDAHGHTCGGGVMGYLAQNALAGSDGLLSETFYDGNDSFLPLADGHIVTAHHNGSQWTVDESGAQALVSVWQALVAERADDASKAQAVAALNTQLGDAQATIQKLQAQIAQLEASQSDPQAQAAKALMTQLKATLAQF